MPGPLGVPLSHSLPVLPHRVHVHRCTIHSSDPTPTSSPSLSPFRRFVSRILLSCHSRRPGDRFLHPVCDRFYAFACITSVFVSIWTVGFCRSIITFLAAMISGWCLTEPGWFAFKDKAVTKSSSLPPCAIVTSGVFASRIVRISGCRDLEKLYCVAN